MAHEKAGESKQTRMRFRGPAVNNNTEAPELRKKRKSRKDQPVRPLKTSISQAWAERTGNEEVRDAAPEAPAGWTIFELAIPDCDLLEEDLGWVADVEDMDA